MSNVSKIIVAALVILLLAGGVFVMTRDDDVPESTNQTNNDQTDDSADNSEDEATEESESDIGVETNEVSIVSSSSTGFNPSIIRIKPGTKVTWTNNNSLPHIVEFDDESSDSLDQGDTFEKTFETVGTYEYSCSIHPNMTGTVIVEA